MNKEKTIKAWAVATKNNVIIDCSDNWGVSLEIFTTRKAGLFYIKDLDMEEKWQVIPIEIKVLVPPKQ